MFKGILFALAALLAAPWRLPAQDKPQAIQKEREIVLEGGPSFDLVNVDPAQARLYVAHSPNVDVLDLKKGERIGMVSGVEGAHAAIAVPGTRRGFATSGPKKRLLVFDLETFKVQKEIETGENPDGLLYVPSIKEVWCFNGRSNNVTCVDPTTLEVKATIALEGRPEAAVDNPDKGLVYVNLEDKSAVSVIDVRRHEAIETHSIAPGQEPTGIAFDPKHGLLFSGCANKMLVAIELATWKVVGSAEIGEKCDGVAFDPETGNVYASCRDRSGGLHVTGAKAFETLAPLETTGGKTCALDPKTHKLYVACGPPRGEKGAVKILIFSPK